MILRGVAKRYAVALFNAAVGMDIAEQVQGDLQSFRALLESNARFRAFLRSPRVQDERKRDLLVKILGERSSGLFLRFLLLLIDKKRLESFEEITVGYTHLFEQRQGILEVKVVTAVPLEGDLEQKTRERLETETGKEIRLVKIDDPGIIGGVVMMIEDKIIDGSIRYQLDTMRKELKGLKVH